MVPGGSAPLAKPSSLLGSALPAGEPGWSQSHLGFLSTCKDKVKKETKGVNVVIWREAAGTAQMSRKIKMEEKIPVALI